MHIQQILSVLLILTAAHATTEQTMQLQGDPERPLTFDLTFGLVVGKLVIGEAKPSLLEVLHSKTVSPLSPLYHKSEEKWKHHSKP